MHFDNFLKNNEWEEYLPIFLTKTQLEKIIVAYFSIFFQRVSEEFKIFRHVSYRSKFLAYIFQRSAKNAKFLPDLITDPAIWSLIKISGIFSTDLDHAAKFPTDLLKQPNLSPISHHTLDRSCETGFVVCRWPCLRLKFSWIFSIWKNIHNIVDILWIKKWLYIVYWRYGGTLNVLSYINDIQIMRVYHLRRRDRFAANSLFSIYFRLNILSGFYS